MEDDSEVPNSKCVEPEKEFMDERDIEKDKEEVKETVENVTPAVFEPSAGPTLQRDGV